MEAQIHLTPLSGLEDTYSISRSILYDRIKALAIVSIKKSGKGYLNAEQMELLDQLDDWLTAKKGTIADFLAKKGLAGASILPDPNSRQPTAAQGLTKLAGLELLPALVTALGNVQNADSDVKALIERLEALKRVEQEGWLLTSLELGLLLGVAGASLSRLGQAFTRYGYTFTRVGKQSGQITWHTHKPQA